MNIEKASHALVELEEYLSNDRIGKAICKYLKYGEEGIEEYSTKTRADIFMFATDLEKLKQMISPDEFVSEPEL